MGIAVDAASIFFGSIFGSMFKKKACITDFSVLAISIMLISLVGFLENIFNISDMQLTSDALMVVIFSLIAGSMIGEFIHIEDNLSKLSNGENVSHNAFVDAMLFFGVGGLQISGPIMLGVNGDSGQLLIKSLVDFPFALVFGATYGKITSLSAIPVAIVQIIIAVVSRIFGSIFNESLIAQLCSMGYIILFFSGFNLISEKNKINNVNMLPGILIVFIYNSIVGVIGGLK